MLSWVEERQRETFLWSIPLVRRPPYLWVLYNISLRHPFSFKIRNPLKNLYIPYHTIHKTLFKIYTISYHTQTPFKIYTYHTIHKTIGSFLGQFRRKINQSIIWDKKLNDIMPQPELLHSIKNEKGPRGGDPTSCPRIVFRGAHIRDAHVPV